MFPIEGRLLDKNVLGRYCRVQRVGHKTSGRIVILYTVRIESFKIQLQRYAQEEERTEWFD